MYIFDVHVGEHMMCVCVSVPVCSASPVCPVQCYQPSTIVLLKAVLCNYVRLSNQHQFTHAKWLLLLMTWCCNGKFFELLTLHKMNAKLGSSVTCTCFIFEDIR